MFGLSPEILALIGAIFGGGGLKFIEHWLNRNKRRDDAATVFRNELREEIKNLRTELRTVEDELDEWRTKYYALVEELSKARIDRDTALSTIQQAAEKAVKAVEYKKQQGQ